VDRSGTRDEDFKSDGRADGRLGRESVALDLRVVADHTWMVESERMSLEWSPGERLTPWLVLDLPRAAWVVEKRAAELTAEERQIVRDAAARMLRAVSEAG
jgi:hypothetical protein